MFRFGRGQFSRYLPTQVTRVPVTLLGRPYPGNPQGFQRAIAEYAAGDIPAAMYPRRMLFGKYKEPSPIKPRFGGDAVGAAMAGGQPGYPWSPDQMIGGHVQRPQPYVPARVPVMADARFAHTRGLARLPQPSDNMAVNLRAGYRPLTRGAWPANDSVTAQTVARGGRMVVQRFIDTTQAPAGVPDRTPEAMAAVERVRHEYRRMMTDEADRPWFLVAPK